MSKEPTMINKVVELLAEGKTSRDIQAETGCSASTVTMAKKRFAAAADKTEPEEGGDNSNKQTTPSPDESGDGGGEEEYDNAISNFIKSIKIVPDTDVLTNDKKDDKADEDRTVECGACHHEWSVEGDDYIEQCPKCGARF